MGISAPGQTGKQGASVHDNRQQAHSHFRYQQYNYNCSITISTVIDHYFSNNTYISHRSKTPAD